jgi:hypothetical protein
MLKYEDFYKRIGLRKVLHFIDPKPINGNSFEFPKSSIFYWFKTSDVLEIVSPEYGYLTNVKKPIVKTILDYNNDALGSFKRTSESEVKIISNLKKKSRKFEFIKSDINRIRLSSDNTLLIVNYGALNSVYRYNSNPLNRYYKWHNVFSRVIDQSLNKNFKSDRDRFILIDLPFSIPTISKLDIYAKKILVSDLKQLANYRYLTLIDFWKFLTPEYKSESILGRVPQEDMKNINFVFQIDNKVLVLNMEILDSMVEEYSSNTDIQKNKASTVRKIFYIMLNKLLANASNHSKDIDNDKPDEKEIVVSVNKITETKSDKKENNVDLNDIIDNDITKPEENFEGEEIDLEDTSDIEDELETNAVELKSVISEVEDSMFADMDALLDDDRDPKENIVSKVEKLKELKMISNKEAETIEDILTSQEKINSPYGDGKLSEILDESKDMLEITKEDTAITDNLVILDKTMNNDTTKALDKKYIEEQLKKDIVRTIYSIQNGNSVVEDYQISNTETVLGGLEEHQVTIRTLGGRPTTLKIMVPKIESDGTFKLSGNTYRMRKQRADGNFTF